MVMRVVYNIKTLELVQGYNTEREDIEPPFPQEAVPIEDFKRIDIPGDAREIMRTLHPHSTPTRKKYMLTPDLQQIILNPDFDDPILSIPQLVIKIKELETRLSTIEAKVP